MTLRATAGPGTTEVVDVFETMAEAQGTRCLVLRDRPSGLRAVIAIDDVTLGPAAGGIRTHRYASTDDAIAEAIELARAMTLKCALAGLDAGGAKAVVLLHDGMHREDAFEALGRFIDELGGVFRTAGDYGTTDADLARVARRTRYVHLGGELLARAVGRGVVRCIEACLALSASRPRLDGLHVAVQGCGAVGAATARALAAAGARLVLADVVPERAEALAHELDAGVVPPSRILFADVDVVAPCALAHAIDEDTADAIRAFAICGAANNQLASRGAARILDRRGVLFVPDVIASAGAVIEGVGEMVMGLADRGPLIDALRGTAERVLRTARDDRALTIDVAERLARERIAAKAAR